MNNIGTTHLRGAGQGPGRWNTLRRWGGVAGGSALAVFGATRRSKAGAALAAAGGALVYFGVTANEAEREKVARSSILLNCTREQAYRFWRDFENMPRFMRHLENITVLGDRRSRWVALGPGGRPIQWEAEIVSERENESLRWQSLPGSDLDMSGTVEFRDAPGNRGTLLMVHMRYMPKGGGLGHAIARMMGKDPSFMMRQDLRRLKALIETGEIPTTEGQSHGPRDTMTAAFRLMDPDRPLRRGTRIREALEAERRAS